jgi:hypothetical protein
MNDPRGTLKENDPRKTLNQVLKNIHGSLKWYWHVVMGLAMVHAIEKLYDSIFSRDCSTGFNASLSFIFVFVPMFIRFYFGDSRYLDEHYIEHRKWRPINEYMEDINVKISKLRFLLDIVLLMVIGILFVFMALSIADTRIFFSITCGLLLFNIIWLTATSMLNSKQRITEIIKQKRYDAPHTWIVNNSMHVLCMVAVLLLVPQTAVFFGTNIQQLVFLCLCISNSIFDVKLTRDFYLPKLDASLDQRLRSSSNHAKQVLPLAGRDSATGG